MRILVAGILWCLASLTAHSADAEDDVAAIKAFGEKWLAAYTAGDTEALENLYEPDAWLMAAGQPAKKGRAAILEHFKTRGGSQLDISFDYEDIVIDGDYAFSIAPYYLRIHPPNGESIKIAGRSFLVFKRGNDGAWRVWRDMDNQTPDIVFGE